MPNENTPNLPPANQQTGGSSEGNAPAKVVVSNARLTLNTEQRDLPLNPRLTLNIIQKGG